MIYKNKWILVLSLLIIPSVITTNASEVTKAAKTADKTEVAKTIDVTKAAKITKNDESKNTNFWSFINEAPPPGFIYFTFLLAFAAFFWKVIEFLVNRTDKNKERLAGLKTEYWFKYIVMPMCVAPLIDFIMQHANKIYILSSECDGTNAEDSRKKYDEFLKNFKDEKNFISCKLFLLDSLEGELYQETADTIDEIDDIVTQHCYLSSVDSATTDDRHYEDVSIVRQNMIYKLNEILAKLYSKYKDANNIS